MTIPTAADYERLGVLYLGRAVDPQTGALGAAPLLYASKHLVTHGVIVGMTGSGKTGLGAVLLEEAAIDGIPAIVVDPKGDLANLLLTFPSLAPSDFAPWAPPGEDPATLASRAATGLAEWGQDGARIGRFAGAVERTVYTPGASFGRPLSLLPPVGAPRGADAETLRERAVDTASGLLTLVGADADPLTSPMHTLLASVLVDAWTKGSDLDPTTLLRAVQQPPFDRIGAMDLESVAPAKDRQALALRINNALASPAMAGFATGEPLDVARLLYAPDGRPRLSILSLAHLGDAERSFFVTVLLSEVLAWMRAQPGTTSLRALLYMDEVFGFFPPVAAPPTKRPMLALLKQARAFGLGVVLATQNPVDLDYKGLANCGTWMLGRLQTERDKLRVLDGLEGAAGASGQALDRARMDSLLSGLAQRTFLLHSVHEAQPTLFRTRWALSYLRGPLSRAELTRLTAGAAPVVAAPQAAPSPMTLGTGAAGLGRPVLAADVPESFLVRSDLARVSQYRPGLLVASTLHYVDAKAGVDTWATRVLIAPLYDDGPRWAEAWALDALPPLSREPIAGPTFALLPGAAMRAATYKTWSKQAMAHLVRERPLVILAAPLLGLFSNPGETREQLAARVAQATRERRDEEMDTLASKWQPKIEKAREKVERAERKLDDARADQSHQYMEVGASVLGAMLGGRRRASTVVSRAARASRKSTDRARAEQDLAKARADRDALERDVHDALETLRTSWDPARIPLEQRSIAPRKADVTIDRLELCWVPV